MEEPKILRKNQAHSLPIEISCEKIDGKYRVSTTFPMDNFINCPVIKEKGIPFSEHPMLRPFDKFLLRGDPNIGKIIHVFILYHEINHPAIVCSIIKTEKRILILPAWGTGLMKPLSKQNVKAQSPVAHITIEEDTNGDFTIHYTGSIEENGKKKKNYPRSKLDVKNEQGLHIGTLGVNELTNLDPLGIVYRDLNEAKLPRNDVKEVERILQESLSPHNPLCILPPEFSWDEKHHLEISFALIGNKLENVKYPKDYLIPPKKNTVEQMNKIPLNNEKSLLVTFTMCSGKLSNAFQWKRGKRSI